MEQVERPELAGERITIRDEGGELVVSFDDNGTGRHCGSCTLCCKLVPVPPLGKPAGVKCAHQSAGKGCAIHASRPWACRTWSCRWLADGRTAGMARPDRCHYVIDMVYDYVTLRVLETLAESRITVLQVWLDPAFPEARRDPRLRALMLRMAAEQRVATILRWNSHEAITVLPPPLTSDGQWHEVHGGLVEKRDPREQFSPGGGRDIRVKFVP